VPNIVAPRGDGSPLNVRVKGNGHHRCRREGASPRLGLSSGHTWTAVATGAGTSHALDSTGDLYAFGDNTNGQVGNGASGGSVVTPTLVLTGADMISATSDDTVAQGSSPTRPCPPRYGGWRVRIPVRRSWSEVDDGCRVGQPRLLGRLDLVRLVPSSGAGGVGPRFRMHAEQRWLTA
jgi:hypothetical protein